MIYRAEIHWADLQVDILKVGEKYKGKEVKALDAGENWLRVHFPVDKTAVIYGVPFVVFDDGKG